jgi:hypothetical protein
MWRFTNLSWFLSEICGKEERDLIINHLIPAMIKLAINVQYSKPFIGEK